MPGTMLAGEKAACSTSAKIVVRVAVELHHADLDQRIVRLRPDLGQVERIVRDASSPAASVITWMNSVQRGKSPRSIAFEQVAPVAFAVVGDQGRGLGVGEVLDALLGAEVELDPEPLVGGVDQVKVWLPKHVHVAEALRDAAVAHHDGDLVQRLGQQRPEIPVVVGAAQPVRGSRLIAWLRSGNRSGSRKKNTGVLLPTMSQLPSSV